MKFFVPNYSCLQNPWLRSYRPQIPVLSVLCPQLNLLNPPEQNSWVHHCRRKCFANFRCNRAEIYSELVAGLISLQFTYNLYFWNATFDINFSVMTGDAFFLLVYQINRNNRAECLSRKIFCIGWTFSSEILEYNIRKSPFDSCPKSFKFLFPRQTNI